MLYLKESTQGDGRRSYQHFNQLKAALLFGLITAGLTAGGIVLMYFKTKP